MRKTILTLLIFCFILLSAPCLAKDAAKSPDKKKDVTYSCTVSRKTMTCTLTLNSGGKTTVLRKMIFPSTVANDAAEVVHFCKTVWGPDSKKLVYYCYYETNFPENGLFPDQNVYLYLYDLSTNKKTELKKGGLKSSWFLGKITSTSTCTRRDSVQWGSDKNSVFLQFDGKKITYHVAAYSNDSADKYCQKVNCAAPTDMNECSGPIGNVASIVTQNTDKKILSQKDICYYYEVCD
jgi:hypothetical protein